MAHDDVNVRRVSARSQEPTRSGSDALGRCYVGARWLRRVVGCAAPTSRPAARPPPPRSGVPCARPWPSSPRRSSATSAAWRPSTRPAPASLRPWPTTRQPVAGDQPAAVRPKPGVAEVLGDLGIPHFLPLYASVGQALDQAASRPPSLQQELRLAPTPAAPAAARGSSGRPCGPGGWTHPTGSWPSWRSCWPMRWSPTRSSTPVPTWGTAGTARRAAARRGARLRPGAAAPGHRRPGGRGWPRPAAGRAARHGLRRGPASWWRQGRVGRVVRPAGHPATAALAGSPSRPRCRHDGQGRAATGGPPAVP
jgi:hypothetical protein